MSDKDGSDNNIKAVMFDVGGVLGNGTDPYIYDEAARIFNTSREDTVNAIHKLEPNFQIGKITEHEFWEGVSKELGIDPPPEQIFGVWGSVHLKVFKSNQDTFRLVKKLRSAGYITGVISNIEMPHVKNAEKTGIFKEFDPIILSCEVGTRKPGKDIFQLALDKLGLHAEKVVFTDDNENKMTGAKQLGMHTHVFKSAAGFEKWLKGMGLEF